MTTQASPKTFGLSNTFTEVYGVEHDGSDLHLAADHLLFTHESATNDCINLAAQIAERAATYDPDSMNNLAGLARDLTAAETKRSAQRDGIRALAFLIRKSN